MIADKGAKPEKVLRLIAVATGQIRMIRELSTDETDTYLKAQEHLLNHDEAGSLTEIVRRNLLAFEECVKGYSSLIPLPGQRGTLSRDAKLDVNRHFLNFLSAVRQLLDHTEMRLKREYAGNPEVYEAFRKRASKAFDRVFAYRMLYKLRNYSQHCGAPIGIVEYQSETKRGSEEVVHTLHLFFDAQHLLRVGGDIWGIVKADLKKIGTKFPVDALPRIVMAELEAIWSVVQHAERPFLDSSAQTVLATVREVNPPYITPAVVRYWHGKTTTTIQFINPPVGTMAWLGDHTFKEIL